MLSGKVERCYGDWGVVPPLSARLPLAFKIITRFLENQEIKMKTLRRNGNLHRSASARETISLKLSTLPVMDGP